MEYDISEDAGNLPTMTQDKFESLAADFVEKEFSKVPAEQRVYLLFKDAAAVKAEYHRAFLSYIEARFVLTPGPSPA